MNNSIKLEIPLEAETLITTATMLTGLAASLKGEITNDCENIDADTSHIEATIPVSQGGTKLDTPPATATNSEESLYTSPGTIDEQQAAIAAAKLKEGFEPPGVDLDSNGLPWDGRIHSAGKTKLVKDQTWKKKRGLDPALILQVENELRQAMAAPAAPVATTAAEAFAEVTPPAAEVTPPLADTQVPPASITPAPATTIPPAANAEPLTFPIIMGKVTTAMALGTLTQEMITAAVGELGIASITLLSARPDLIDAANAKLFPNG